MSSATVNMEELERKGYTVVTGVLSAEDCDAYIDIYNKWLSQFEKGSWPRSAHSLIQRYRVGHMEPSWGVRVKTKPIFEQIWNTDELLTSFDAVAIGRPPESGEETFASPSKHWLHCDQSVKRTGLHAYQGAVYLEAAEADDWTFEVLERSHLLHTDFFESSQRAKIRSITNKHYSLRDEDVDWYTNHPGIQRVRVPVPKGGMVLWDSRLIHANTRPLEGRKHPGRWRYVVFVCMGPAAWATHSYVKAKQEAYNSLKMTSHWPCDELTNFSDQEPTNSGVTMISELPTIAKTDEAKRLAGVLPYKGARPGPQWKPKWVDEGPERIDNDCMTQLLCGAMWLVTSAVIQGIFEAVLSGK